MKTEVIMQRELFGHTIQQKSKSEFFSATDLVKAGNKWRMANNIKPFNFNQWRNSEPTKEFIKEIEDKFGTAIISGRGRGVNTWVHPYLFLDIALAIDPKLKIEVYEWIFDSLLKYRNESGDSYKKMCGALYNNTTAKSSFSKDISKIADLIRVECGVKDWQKASEWQLKLREKMHEYISLFCDMFHNKNSEAVRIGILKAKEFNHLKQ
jgi:hypothetical protein